MTRSRDGWTRVRFGDIAEQINDRVDDPNAAGVDRYVGLEHLDTDSLRVTRWGSPDEVSAQKLRFRPGDIIFGKRRAYQRKVAIANFEGICSAHAMVLREREGAIAPGFLIHFMASDAFMERAVQISVGSLSPTINWSTLRDQEFDLPPIEIQRTAAKGLIAADALKEELISVLAAATALARSYTHAAMDSDSAFRLTVEAAIADGLIEAPQDGNHGEKHPKASDYCDRGIPFLMAADLADDAVDLTRCKFIPKRLADSLRIGFAKCGDVLLTHKGTIGQCVIVPPLSTDYVMLTPQVTYYRVLPNGPLMREYLAVLFRSPWFQSQMHAGSTGSTRAYIGITAQRQLTILCPPLDRQREVVRVTNALASARRQVERRLSTLRDVIKGMVSRSDKESASIA